MAYRYRATDYLTQEAARREEYRDLLRAKGRIAGLMRALLLKRLESSIAAFRSTLNALIGSNRNFKQALEEGYVPIGSTATRILAGADFDAEELLETLQQEEQRRQERGLRRATLVHSTDDFEVIRWLDDLVADYETLSEIRDRIADIDAEDDDKLHSLQRFLNDPETEDGKVLIFSESETTIDYLHEQLNPDGQSIDIAKLSGSVGRDRAANIVRRFSPKSNFVENGRLRAGEIRILLATDVVSEGQNLQDCARVLNYDLHWNPVRLIQRFGRVDRIGSTHSDIYLHNMWPDLDVDEDLALTERLNNRIQMFHDLIGLDSRLLSDSERLNNADMYRIYAGNEMPELNDELDEASAGQRAQALLQRVQREDSELWQTVIDLPDGLRSALKVHVAPDEAEEERNDQFIQAPMGIEGGQMPMGLPVAADVEPSPFDAPGAGETLVLLASGDLKGCYAVADDLRPRQITPAQFVTAAECLPDTLRESLPAKTNERVMAAVKVFQGDAARRLGSMRRRRDTRNRRYLSRQLHIAMEQATADGGDTAQIDILRRIFLGDLPASVESHLTEIRSLQLTGSAMLTRLRALRERYRLNPRDESAQPSPTQQVIRVVCSDGLVE